MLENSINEERNNESIKIENDDDGHNRINTINSINSRKDTKNSRLRENSIFSEFKDIDSRKSSIASFIYNDRANTLVSRDCALEEDIVPIELKDEIQSFNPDLIIPPLLMRRTRFFKEMNYIDILKMEKSEIGKPLLKMEDENDIETAKQMFRNLLSYMKLRKSSKEPILHAKKFLRLIKKASPILKDEAYLQIYKQLHDNHEYESYMSAFKMLGILSSCFVPHNKNIFIFILQYLFEEMKNNKNALVINHIKYIVTRMLKIKDHERNNIPCKEEIEFIEFLRPIPIIVYLFDGTKVNVNVESYSSIKEVKENVINELFLDNQNSMNYCLYEICTKTDETEERFLDDSERICDIISVWKSEMDKDIQKKIDSFFRFYFRIIIFSKFSKDDEDSLNRVYYQNAYDVIAGRFPLDEEKIITLSSLQLYNEYFDDSIRAKASLEQDIDLYVPKNKLVLLEKEELIKKIMDKYLTYKGITRNDAQWNYLEELKNIHTYQMTQFEAKYNQNKSSSNEDNIPEKCIIGIKPDGICILDEELNQIVLYDYEIILNWGISKDQFILSIQKDVNSIKKISFFTSQTKVIQTVIEVYCNMKVGQSKKNIKEIVDRYDEKFKSIDSSKKVKDMVHKSGARGSNFNEAHLKELNDTDSINEIVNEDEIFKDRVTNAMMRMSDVHTKK